MTFAALQWVFDCIANPVVLVSKWINVPPKFVFQYLRIYQAVSCTSRANMCQVLNNEQRAIRPPPPQKIFAWTLLTYNGYAAKTRCQDQAHHTRSKLCKMCSVVFARPNLVSLATYFGFIKMHKARLTLTQNKTIIVIEFCF